MKVVMAGASGSGKTTLARELAKEMGWYFTENSAGLILSDRVKEYMFDKWGYKGNLGQKEVINKSHTDPEFGKFFQQAIYDARVQLMYTHREQNCVFDRSVIDPLVFWLNQVVHNTTPEETEDFVRKCTAQLKYVDLVIRIPLQNPDNFIENNGSRVANYYFQEKIDALYERAIGLMIHANIADPTLLYGHRVKFINTPGWDWNKRFEYCLAQLKENEKNY